MPPVFLKRFCRVVALLPVLLALTSLAAPPARAREPARVAVASAHPLATRAGIAIMRQGGNAFDAAIAVAAVLAVVEPYSSGIGGGGFWLLHRAGHARDIMLDGRERAPLRARRDMYLDAKGQVRKGASITGSLAAGIPGVPAALAHLAGHYGRLPLAASLRAAIELAGNGFEADPYYLKMARFRLADMQADAETARIFLADGQLPAIGQRIVQKDLAKTLRRLAEKGYRGFYEGETALRLVHAVRKHGGIWTMKDLATYEVVERDPVVAYYQGMKLTSAALPSSGGLVLAEMLNILSQFDLEGLSRARRVHLIVEAMRRAYRDRAEYMGDADHVLVPEDYLLSEAYALELAGSIDRDEATRSERLRPVYASPSGGNDTTHYSIIDAEGNRVSATLSINYPFGACFVAAGTGVLLNDEMDDFSIKPGTPNVYGLVGNEANAIAPGKRPLSSMSPSFAETRDRLAIVGTPGGSRIITMVLNAVLEFFNGGNARSMVALRRFHHQYLPDSLFYEPGAFSPAVADELTLMGHHLAPLKDTYGNMQVIVQDKRSGALQAASDPRGIGKAEVALIESVKSGCKEHKGCKTR